MVSKGYASRIALRLNQVIYLCKCSFSKKKCGFGALPRNKPVFQVQIATITAMSSSIRRMMMDNVFFLPSTSDLTC